MTSDRHFCTCGHLETMHITNRRCFASVRCECRRFRRSHRPVKRGGRTVARIFEVEHEGRPFTVTVARDSVTAHGVEYLPVYKGDYRRHEPFPYEIDEATRDEIIFSLGRTFSRLASWRRAWREASNRIYERTRAAAR